MMTENRIGKKINQFRKEKKLTIKEFSDLSGISTALVSQLERGIGNPTLSVLRQVCRTLEISMSSLFFEEIDNASLICRSSERERIHNPKKFRLLQSYAGAAEIECRSAADVAESAQRNERGIFPAF